MRVLVTGGTGLIGRRLVQRLLENGDQVHVLARHPIQALALRKVGAHVVGGDIGQPRTLEHALKYAEVVYHTAALVGPGIITPPYTLANVTGVANMLATAEAAGAQRFVHVSDVVVYAHAAATESGAVTEDAPISSTGHHNAYVATKVRGEALVRAAGERGVLATVIVRPVRVYDGGSRPTDLRSWAKSAARLPLLALPGGGDQVIDIIHADDVARLLILCGNHADAVGRTYNASSDERLTWRDLLRNAGAAATKGPRIIPLPSRHKEASFPATRAHTELGYTPTLHWSSEMADESPS